MVATLTRSCRPHDCLCYSQRKCDGLKGALRREVVEGVHLYCCGRVGWLGEWQDAYRLLRRGCPRHALCGGKTGYDLTNWGRRKIPPSEL